MPTGRYAAIQPFLASAARTTSGNSNWWNMEEFGRVTFYVDVTAIAGTGTNINIKLQESPDQSIVSSISEIDITAIGDYRISTNEHIKYVRANYTISGGSSKSITFSIDAGART